MFRQFLVMFEKMSSPGCLGHILSFGDPIWVILVGEEP